MILLRSDFGITGLGLFVTSQRTWWLLKFTSANFVFLGWRPCLWLKVSLQSRCSAAISSIFIWSCRLCSRVEMENSSSACSGGRDKKSLTGFDLAGKYLRSLVHWPSSTIWLWAIGSWVCKSLLLKLPIKLLWSLKRMGVLPPKSLWKYLTPWCKAYSSRLNVVQRCLELSKCLEKKDNGLQFLPSCCSSTQPMAFWLASPVMANGLLGSGKVRVHADFNNSLASWNDTFNEGSSDQ